MTCAGVRQGGEGMKNQRGKKETPNRTVWSGATNAKSAVSSNSRDSDSLTAVIDANSCVSPLTANSATPLPPSKIKTSATTCARGSAVTTQPQDRGGHIA
jgi:hypothetical protein